MTRAIEDYSRRPTAAGMPLAMRRQEIEATIERLITELDEMDGDCDMESYLSDDDGDEREDDPSESGIADWDGLYEQTERGVVA